jgi:hypothetical protein
MLLSYYISNLVLQTNVFLEIFVLISSTYEYLYLPNSAEFILYNMVVKECRALLHRKKVRTHMWFS